MNDSKSGGNQRTGVIAAAIIGAGSVIIAAYIQRPHGESPANGNAPPSSPAHMNALASVMPPTPLQALTTRAESGDRNAQTELADTYYFGRGVARSFSRALYWYRQAASSGAVAAQTQAGWMYTRGIGTSMNRTEAARWFRLAADAGDARAQNYLGWAYVQGWGVPTDYSSARYWLGKSAEANDRLGLYNYGVVHERGLGGPVDLPAAIDLYRRSAANGYADARDALRRLNAD
jgi:uncharacterized protein